MDGARYDSLENIEFALGDDPDRWDEKNVAIEIHNIAAGSVPMTYTIHIRQMDPVSVTFKTEPENARILVKNNGNKKTVLPENGVYRLIPEPLIRTASQPADIGQRKSAITRHLPRRRR